MPPVNDYPSGAITLDLAGDSYSGTIAGVHLDTGDINAFPWPDVWFRLAPLVDQVVRIELSFTSGILEGSPQQYANHPEADVHDTTTDPPTDWAQLGNTLSFYIYGPGTGETVVDGGVALVGGTVYYLYVYPYPMEYPGYAYPSPYPVIGTDWFGAVDYTITVAPNNGPPNDLIVDAQVMPVGLSSTSGTTVDATTEGTETDWDSTPSVWYKVNIGGPGEFTVHVTSTTPGWAPEINLYRATGPVTSYSDLIADTGGTDMSGDGTEEFTAIYDQIGTGISAGNLSPLEGGEEFWVRVSGYLYDGPGDEGSFTIEIFTPPTIYCLDAADYLGSSSTASIVAGSVRETQQINTSWGALPKAPFEGFLGDSEDTLSIPGADILNGSPMGFYAVTIKTKNASEAFNWNGGMKRNGQPLWPGAYMDSTSGSTPLVEHLTMKAGSPRPNELDMVKYLPVHPDDTIEIVVAYNNYNGTHSIDITQICFQRILDATPGVPYALLDIPDFPLGTVVGDLGTIDHRGDLFPDKGGAPVVTDTGNHNMFGNDMVVTNDGVIWVVYNANVPTASGLRYIGPCLMKWDPGSPGWSVVNNDIEGLGFKRTFRGGTSVAFGPYHVHMDTDGEDLWMCYGVDNGAFAGGGRKTAIRVKKYDVGGASFSNVGGLIEGTDHVDPFNTAIGEISHQAGGFDYPAVVRVSPSGVPWVSFLDFYGPDSGGLPAWMANWTGSSWNIVRLPETTWYEVPDVSNLYQAETYRYASGTTSEVTEDSEVCVRETQTGYTNDTIRIIPPAGDWTVRLKYQYNKTAGSGGVKARLYKNGTPISAQTDHYASATSGTAPSWHYTFESAHRYYQTFNGTTDELEIRIARTGTATEVFLDEFILLPARVMITNLGVGPLNAGYATDGQPMTAHWMHQVGETGLGENPGALYGCASVKYTADPDEEGYVPPGEYASSFAIAYQTWVYSEWNGSEWVRVWQRMIEEDAPEHVYVVTTEDNIASTPPYGHFHQGLGFCTDGIDNYMTANLGGGQAFGFFGDTIVALKIGPNGFVPFTEGPPAHLQGPGYPQGLVLGLSGFSGWSWITTARSIHVDINGSVWLGWDGVGATGNHTDFVGTAAPNGIGGWFAAAETNEDGGWDPIEAAQPVIYSSSDGGTVYILWDTYIWEDSVAGQEPSTFGVWECPVIPNAKIPLIPILLGAIDLTRIKFRGFQIGDA